MATLEGILKKLKGSAGSLTFKQVNGQTVVSEKATTVKNTRTSGQQRQRTKWGNVVQMYKGIMPLINGGFEQKALRCSDFQMFMKVNMPNADIYLTKQEVAGGGCVAAPYQITQGSLPSIVTSGSGDNVRTDIKLGELTIDAETTVKDFSIAVVNNNADYDYGDQISFFDVLQRVNAVTGIPYCQFLATNVVLDKASDVKLLDIVSKYGFAVVDGYLGHQEGEGAGVFAWVHSRKSSAKTLVSTQMLINNNADMIAEYSGAEGYKRAVKTYGGENSAFLTPGTTNTTATDGSDSAGEPPTPPVSDGGTDESGSGTDQGGGTDEGGGGYYE
ncbi:MAG: DUF6266 family protein [Prevotella sp.]|nr:DUF6266 family protein [Prevotella sp.]MDD7030160.1 DUF6266 family protein [Prevotellaceae bacterium]MDY4555290.1 DUF6266 family protein [Prevotella sp.]MDY5210091.1 DUF6266 family protein [Prevotella sp.]